MIRSTTRGLILASLVAMAATGISAANDNWPHFRGPTMNATVADNPNLPETWSQTENVEWVADIPGIGWSSPVVWGNRVFLTTVTAAGDFEQPKPGLYAPNGRPIPPPLEHDWLVYCLDLESGDVLWQRSVKAGRPDFPRHMKNSYASETATTDGERVYVRFGEVGLFTFDMEGNEVWSVLIPHKRTKSEWGSASSPVLHDGRLYIVSDNDEQSYLLALDAATGKQVWRVDRPEKSNWSTPYVWQNKLRTEIITPGSGRCRSYGLDGKLLYEWGGCSSITIATPYSKFGLLYVSSGYVGDRRKPIYAIRPGASGDISFKEDETSNEHIAWCQKRAAPYNPTTLVYGDLLYVLLDRGIMACYEAKTGELVYSRQRLQGGRAFTSSPWAYNGKIFCLNEYGQTYVIKAGREFELLHTNSLEEDELCMATPAMAGDKLIIRSEHRVYCIARQKQ